MWWCGVYMCRLCFASWQTLQQHLLPSPFSDTLAARVCLAAGHVALGFEKDWNVCSARASTSHL